MEGGIMVRYLVVRSQVELGTVSKQRIRKGFTLVELLVVIAIIGILVSLLLPAIQAAREAARRSQCVNNLKQVSLGAMNHESAFKAFPSTGLGHGWVGDPNYGHGRTQPGGWIYNTLPFIEEQVIHDMGLGVGTSSTDPARKKIFAERAPMTIKTMICPSRRGGGPYANRNAPGLMSFSNQDGAAVFARSDYAGNLGDGKTATFPGGSGPESPPTDYQLEFSDIKWFGKYATGVFTYGTLNRLKSITDGLSKTYCVGEKWLRPADYENGMNSGDDQSMYSGMDRDNLRWARGRHTITVPSTEELSEMPPIPDTIGDNRDYDGHFGGPHNGVVLMGMCDGSVHAISFDIDPTTHGRLGSRKDGEVVTLP
jgi:prepilin-type N-terminal cleavage/methylation domain-containing protein